MVVVVPSALERELASTLVRVLTHPGDHADTEVLAQALASHRERCTALAAGVITGIEVDARFTVAELDAMLDACPPTSSVRELIEAHRNVLTMLASARDLVRKIGTQPKPSAEL